MALTFTAAADIPVSCRPLTPSKVTMRMNHSQELVDSLMTRAMAAQGFAASLAAGCMVGLDPRHDADQMLLINSPFSNDMVHGMTFEVCPEENGSFTMTYANARTQFSFLPSEGVLQNG